ncbi:hypothetical protein [Streptomyces sp. WAC00469]|uniref:hypothetical protein n=1 Tax=Streptomyces sp. WAC00469 TaxID=2487415 RepID=UPI000F7397E2|nr:hypothetical protein [Streptomyces sp. WAC00469]RSR95432.1 hypothetical protein EF917_25725 [Streptomyces sp. WAC00469]
MPEPATTPYHVIISVRTPGGQHATTARVIDVPVGATRADIYWVALEQMIQQYGHPLITVHFSAEPNQL